MPLPFLTLTSERRASRWVPSISVQRGLATCTRLRVATSRMQVAAMRQASQEGDAALAKAQAEAAAHQHDARTHAIRHALFFCTGLPGVWRLQSFSIALLSTRLVCTALPTLSAGVDVGLPSLLAASCYDIGS